jgi:hypothetical protein
MSKRTGPVIGGRGENPLRGGAGGYRRGPWGMLGLAQ